MNQTAIKQQFSVITYFSYIFRPLFYHFFRLFCALFSHCIPSFLLPLFLFFPLFSSFSLVKLVGSLSRSQTTVIFINQLRSKIGVMYGNPEVTAGGNALKFYSSVRIDIRRKEVLKENDGIMVKIKVVKNKVTLL